MSFSSSVNNGKVQYEPLYKKNFGTLNHIPIYDVNGFIVDSGVNISGFSGGTGTTIIANNGLSKIGNTIVLGGTLTGDTVINQGDSVIQFISSDSQTASSFWSYNDNTNGVYAQQTIAPNVISSQVHDTNVFNKYGFISVSAGPDFAEATIGVNITDALSIDIVSGGANSGITVNDSSPLSKGIVYANDHSSQFVDRSIPDVAYVKTLVSGSTGSSSQNVYGIKVILTGATTLNSANFVVGLNTTSSYIVTLPSSPVDGQVYKFKDATGNALTNNITINGNGKNIDGGSTATINTNYGGFEVCYFASITKWLIMNFIG